MHVVIIGGTGLIGGATAERLLAQGARVTVISRKRPETAIPGCEWRSADIADAALLQQALDSLRADCVVHLAAFLQFACERDPVQAIRVNVDGTLNVLEACRIAGIGRIVFASSIAAYGERTDLMHEDDPPSARIGLYGMTKRLGEMLGERYSALHRLRFVALRYAGVIGPGKVHSPGMALVRQRIKECALGASVAIEGASGDETVHLTHVDDAAEATCRAVLHPGPRHLVYNVGGPPGNHLTLRQFHAEVCRLVPSSGAALWQGKGRSSGPVDISRMREDLGFTPAIDVETALRIDLGLA